MSPNSDAFVAGAFNCTGPVDSPTEITHFNECSYNSSEDYLAACDRDALVRCIPS